MLRTTKGALVEYGLSVPPLALTFDFNPQSLTRTRSITVQKQTPGLRGGYDFHGPTETSRVAQTVTVAPESFTLNILLDATDRMAREDQDLQAAALSQMGIQPELDTLRTMVEPKSQGPGGLRLLSSLVGESRGFRRDEYPSVLLFVWGRQVLPVFITQLQVEETDFLPSLVPYRAKVSITLQVIEGENPFYLYEKTRQLLGAATNAGTLAAGVLKGVL